MANEAGKQKTLQTLHGHEVPLRRIRHSDPEDRESPASTQRRAFWLPSRGRPGYSCGTAPALHRTSPISASPLQTRPSAAHSVVGAHYHGVLRSSKTRVQLCTARDHDRIVRRLLACCGAEDDARAIVVCLTDTGTALIDRALVIHARVVHEELIGKFSERERAALLQTLSQIG
jgi:hypothetical protein